MDHYFEYIHAVLRTPSSVVSPAIHLIERPCGCFTSLGCSVIKAPGKSGSTTGGKGTSGSVSHSYVKKLFFDRIAYLGNVV